MKFLIFFLSFVTVINSTFSQSETFNIDFFNSERTVRTEREKFKQRLIDSTIIPVINLSISDKHSSKWQSALWAAQLIRYRSIELEETIRRDFNNVYLVSSGLQRIILEGIYSLYPNSFEKGIASELPKYDNPKVFAIACEYLLRINHTYADTVRNIIVNKNLSKDDPIILSLLGRLTERKNIPALSSLLSQNFDNRPVIFSFQYADREIPGYTFIRNSEGGFLKEDDGNYFFIRHLALSVTGLPYYITNGNTPAGVYSLQGVDLSENVFIGPSPALILNLPYEASTAEFFHDQSMDNIDWSLELYADLLPFEWIENSDIFHAYYAGKAGRSEIIAHGTTINPKFYLEEKYYPFTPSLGCITTLELWSNNSGDLLYSDQIKLINKYLALEEDEGFFVLIELTNNKEYGLPLILETIRNSDKR